MTWNSGSCKPVPPGLDEWADEDGRAHDHSTGARGLLENPASLPVAAISSRRRFGPHNVSTEHERSATELDRELDRELFQRVAETRPGVVRTLGVPVGELAVLNLEPELAAERGDRIRRVGDKVIDNARRSGG